ncbi:MAG: AGE family epimerase/isomerase [Eubacteriales bacterium]|jgi:sulfoquinovose isomerase
MESSSFDKKYQLDTNENRAFLRAMTENLLAFGRRFPSPGGGSYWLGDDGTPWKDRNRETWITARMAHVYSLGYMLGYKECGALADAALKGLRGELHDEKNGGWYPGVTADGTPLPDKQCYAHAFVMLAASSGYLAGRPGAEELLRDAEAVYDAHFWDEHEGLARDTWNTEFTVCDKYRGLNANMHSVEAFLAVADATGNESYRVRAGRVIDHVIGWAKNNGWRTPEHYHEDWTPDLECNADRPDDQFKPYGATPGHGIEWARLIVQWAMSTYGTRAASDGETEAGEASGRAGMHIPAKAAPYIDAAEHLFNRAISDGWCADGEPGIVYTTDWNGKPVVHDRMHWTRTIVSLTPSGRASRTSTTRRRRR